MPSLRSTLAAILAIGAIAPAFAVDAIGCYDNAGVLDNVGPNTYQTQGLCHDQCASQGSAVWAVTLGSICYCGNSLPADGEIDASKCSIKCNGYPQQMCGGVSAWTVGITGVGELEPPKSSTSKASSTAKSSTTSTDTPVLQTTVVQGTATITAPPGETQGQNQGGGGGSSKAGVAAGAVVGVIAIIALGIGAFLIVRRNRRLQAEEEYRAAVAAKEFTASIRKPQPDARLEPVMLQHRLSDGSIADNQDFSRRILKVTNPDA